MQRHLRTVAKSVRGEGKEVGAVGASTVLEVVRDWCWPVFQLCSTCGFSCARPDPTSVSPAPPLDRVWLNKV